MALLAGTSVTSQYNYVSLGCYSPVRLVCISLGGYSPVYVSLDSYSPVVVSMCQPCWLQPSEASMSQP